jgi:hypothetical protein
MKFDSNSRKDIFFFYPQLKYIEYFAPNTLKLIFLNKTLEKSEI